MTADNAAEQGFELLADTTVPELRSHVTFWRHRKTGAEILSLENDDENKVFGITFRTPVSDSTGVAHILEHSVLCGSRKYPLKDPFVELSKGSLKTFLNAMTYADKTCYPVASQNLQDFYNLTDVYLDTVFFPRLTAETFAEQGWHYELEKPEDPLIYKGVVFNEMKGAFSSPERVLFENVRESLYPDTTYVHCSGGDPHHIPGLTYNQFRRFHQTYYHPSNAMIFFYGDDPLERRLRKVSEYLDEFDGASVEASVALQEAFTAPRRLECSYAAGEDAARKAMLSVNWMLPEASDSETSFGRQMLVHILLGTPASPLRKALIDSGLGEDLVGGAGFHLRQPYFAAGLKGISADDAERVEDLVIGTLRRLSEDGIETGAVEAALNSIEFDLRENNTGSTPRGLVVMLRCIPSWQHYRRPLDLLGYESPLATLKKSIAAGRYFEALIHDCFLENPHRTTVLLRPDSSLAEREAEEERERLAAVRNRLSPTDLEAVVEGTLALRRGQETADPISARESLPSLGLPDLEKAVRTVPLEVLHRQQARVLYHDLFTNGIVYLDLAMDLHKLPQRLLPYVPLFSRSLLEMGTETEDFVSLTQRIGRKTGGIGRSSMHSSMRGSPGSSSWLILRGKATPDQAGDLIAILRDVLTTARLDNRERFQQMALETKSRLESSLVSNGSGYADSRLRSYFDEAAWAHEQTGGIAYLFFIRELARAVDTDWPAVLQNLEEIRSVLFRRGSLVCNVTVDSENWERFAPQLDELITALPDASSPSHGWDPSMGPLQSEGFTIPSPVNFVARATGLRDLGYTAQGSAAVVLKYLRTSWLWDRVRKEGGAYGVSCSLDRFSGVLSFSSYRDPNLSDTVKIFDGSARFLRELELSDRELTRAIIGVISDLDHYQLPDSRGYSSMMRYLIGETEEHRQEWRDQVLATQRADFRAFADVLESGVKSAAVAVLGGEAAIRGAGPELGLKVTGLL